MPNEYRELTGEIIAGAECEVEVDGDISDEQLAKAAWKWTAITTLFGGVVKKGCKPTITYASAVNNVYSSTRSYIEDKIKPYLNSKGIFIQYLNDEPDTSNYIVRLSMAAGEHDMKASYSLQGRISEASSISAIMGCNGSNHSGLDLATHQFALTNRVSSLPSAQRIALQLKIPQLSEQ